MLFWRVLIVPTLLSQYLPFTHQYNLSPGKSIHKKLRNNPHGNICIELPYPHSMRRALQTIALATQAVTWLVVKIHSRHNLMLAMWTDNQIDHTRYFEEVQCIAPTEITLLRDPQKSFGLCCSKTCPLLDDCDIWNACLWGYQPGRSRDRLGTCSDKSNGL